ncbi:MAG: YraN family protein [Ignavibacteriales bacterium]|nr:YraN family protein [Ignavibacteriales bacterium]
MTKSKRTIGNIGEDVAVNYLKQQGYVIIEKNFYYQHGEIDIVAKDGDTLVFVEVKARRSERFGSPEESVTPKKQELLRRTAEGYVASKNLANIGCRFDVVSVLMKDGKAECSILKDCF